VKFLITAGPTREPIDPVRYISNRSSGKMGYAIAQAALDAGHEVILVSGPVCIEAPRGAQLVAVTTSDEMFDAVHAHLGGIDIAVMSAAVADFKPANYSAQKIKKISAPEKISLTPTRDILSSLGKLQKKFLLIGFAAETNSLAENARKKLHEKNCDLVVGNDVSRMDTGFEGDDNEVTLFYKRGETFFLPREKKLRLAKKLVKIFEKLQEKS
jgi:phosphopantothenoylcysteine decarboxylase/phosphopantothenate--cysteine ligase